ncbi:helix-turn-helix domain-containing protein [Segniliparus rugosus]|uniref:HTH cro/C1-type domain-containing protein n=1 Tax=Segniliparus rugosus (strain ATCC BAA-974 / DSM 45345 / CCUG 50838 / CIP 108380 / JCM 13579 / CDC 945) TaxID=679197 RepID=E5XRQ4_SEGRC|nr:helix-turn-helix transcriptional regulator [Segniliparus rugosus]EFV12919.1 hypothetical protein HMPREF9336_02176 [Segniliparus rugosus ATCC BAA-974]
MFTLQGKRVALPRSQAETQAVSNLPQDAADASAALVLLQDELRRLRLEAGQPSLRAIAKDVGWSHATIARAFTGANAPKWDLVEALAAHLDGNPDHIRTLWIASMGAKPRPEPAPETVAQSVQPATARFPTASVAAAICALLVVVIVRDFAPGDMRRNERITGVAQLLFVATAALLWWRVALRQRRRENLAVALCLSGWSLIAARDASTAMLGVPPHASPTLTDLVVTYLPNICLIAFLLVSLPKTLRRTAVAATACLIPVGSVVFMILYAQAAAFSQEAQIGFAIYSATHVAACLLVLLVSLLKKTWTWALVLAGCCVLIAVDLLFAFLVSARPDGTVPVGAAAGLLVCPLILIVAAQCAVLETAEDDDLARSAVVLE